MISRRKKGTAQEKKLQNTVFFSREDTRRNATKNPLFAAGGLPRRYAVMVQTAAAPSEQRSAGR